MLTTVLKMPPSVPAASSTSTSENFIRSQDRAVTGAAHRAKPASGCDPHRTGPSRGGRSEQGPSFRPPQARSLAALVPRPQPIFWANMFRIESARCDAHPAATANYYPVQAQRVIRSGSGMLSGRGPSVLSGPGPSVLSGPGPACYPVRVIRSGPALTHRPPATQNLRDSPFPCPGGHGATKFSPIVAPARRHAHVGPTPKAAQLLRSPMPPDVRLSSPTVITRHQ
jgi:hypothetical protein